MSKKLHIIAGLILCLLGYGSSYGQKLFDIPDTVCAQSDITPTVYVNNAQNYSWTFCPPLLGGEPTGTNNNLSSQLFINNDRDIKTIQADSFKYAFALTGQGHLVRYQFVNGMESTPYAVDFNTLQQVIPDGANGLSIVKIDSIWRIFIIGNTNTGDSRLVRVDFANGLNFAPTGTHNYGDINNALSNSAKLFVAMDSTYGYYGITFNDSNKLVKIHFGSNIDNTPTVTNYGNIDGKFSNISAVTGILETSDWHIFVTDRQTSRILHITFGNSFQNDPFVIDMGTFNNYSRTPTGISIVKNCDNYYGYITNAFTNKWLTLFWNGSVADQPTATLYDQFGGLLQTGSLSNAINENGSVFMLATNSDNTLTTVKYAACTNANIAGSNQKNPPLFQYNEPGYYTVYLTVDEGLPTVRTYCQNIAVVAHPELTISPDTQICNFDTISLHALTWGTDSISWAPNYNIDTTEGKFVYVWPEYSQVYNVYANFGTHCLVHDSIQINVIQVRADAGSDRDLVDGTPTVIGGPNTSLGSQYTYLWTPDLFFNTATDKNIAEVKPGYNITYYLHVTDTSGCTAIDSVWVKVPCSDIVLPNAFAPGNPEGNQGFGLMNLQIVQMNYFKIYDRWGKEVFTTTNPSQAWDGRDKNGNLCALGVYVWEVDAYCNDTKIRYRKSGNVTLIR